MYSRSIETEMAEKNLKFIFCKHNFSFAKNIFFLTKRQNCFLKTKKIYCGALDNCGLTFGRSCPRWAATFVCNDTKDQQLSRTHKQTTAKYF